MSEVNLMNKKGLLLSLLVIVSILCYTYTFRFQSSITRPPHRSRCRAFGSSALPQRHYLFEDRRFESRSDRSSVTQIAHTHVHILFVAEKATDVVIVDS